MNKRQFLSEVVKIRNALQEEVLTASFSDSVSDSFWARRKTRINHLYDRLEFAWAEYLNNSKKIFEEERWKQIVIARKERPYFKRIPFRKEMNPEVVRIFNEDSIEDFDFTISNSRKPWMLLMRLLELDNKKGRVRENIKAFLEEEEIERIIREAENYVDARNKIIGNLQYQAQNNQYITLVTNKINPKTGEYKTIRYNIKKYADMLLRTNTRVLQTNGVLHAANEVGSDLVQVSTHNTICPICIEFEGRIYSISGTSQLFPPLTDAPPYHPNCLHSLTVTFVESLYRDGIDKYIDFSKGYSDIHPTVRDWIPIAERHIA